MTSNVAGLTSTEARYRLDRYGANVLPSAQKPLTVMLFLRQVTHFFAGLLWGAAGLALIGGMPQLAIAIVVVVIVNAGFSFIQEYRADRATERLRMLMAVSATVRRDGHPQTIPVAELVPGDLVILEAGDRISADLQLVTPAELAVDESLLTGETVPRRTPTGSQLWAGTYVVDGSGEAVVMFIGAKTRLGKLTILTRSARRPVSPLAVQLRRVVSVIAIAAVGVGTVFLAVAVTLGMGFSGGFLFAVGVMVALVPEGLLPTVTLSLARAAQQMARRRGLVKRLDSVETLGSTTFICTDKTGTLTLNEMTVTDVWTPLGKAAVSGEGYSPQGVVQATPEVRKAVAAVARSALLSSTGRTVLHDGDWQPFGDPMEAALHALAYRAEVAEAKLTINSTDIQRLPFDSHRRCASAVIDGMLHLKGAPDVVLSLCVNSPDVIAAAHQAVAEYAVRGLRVLAVGRRLATSNCPIFQLEKNIELLGIVGIGDPPRPDVSTAIAACRRANIKLAMVTGDHPVTATAVADFVGLRHGAGQVVEGQNLPVDDEALAQLLATDGAVIARVSPEDKLRITQVLQNHGHVVAMTGDGVNDAPALRKADIGVAMGRSGTDVAREAADLVLLDDDFATIVSAVELGRATYANVRRFLTYHLTDNVAELAPFLMWALSGGAYPLALSVLQILALDIGTDLLPAIALGSEPPHKNILDESPARGRLINRQVLVRAFGILGPTEAIVELAAFSSVLTVAGWSWGVEPSSTLLAVASGAAFTTVVLGQLANAFACRSARFAVWQMDFAGNRFMLLAVMLELALLWVFLLPPLSHVLGGAVPTTLGWMIAFSVIPTLLIIDASYKKIFHPDYA